MRIPYRAAKGRALLPLARLAEATGGKKSQPIPAPVDKPKQKHAGY